MSTPGAALDALRQRRPEWSPWLAVVEEVLRETTNPTWDASVPDRSDPHDGRTPLLAGASVGVDATLVRRMLERLVTVASRSGTPKMASLKRSLHANTDILSLFRAALLQESGDVAGIAAASDTDPEALQAVVALLPLPFLHACNRRWASAVSPGWAEGHCPVCASWPAFAEVRGIERSRFFRCGRCGGEWYASILRCGYCGTLDHDDLVALVPGKTGSPAAIDACRHCQGYIKTFTRLQGCAPAAVMLEDLASVDLDVAALEQGFARPSGAGYIMDVAVSDTGIARRFFAWNA